MEQKELKIFTRIVLADGNGTTFEGGTALAIGDILTRENNPCGVVGYTVCKRLLGMGGKTDKSGKFQLGPCNFIYVN